MEVIPEEAKQRLSYSPESGDFTWIKNNKFHPRLIGCAAGSIGRGGYRVIKMRGFPFLAHRVAWFLMTGNQPNIIDHINGNILDNRFCNLRNCTQGDNARNHGKLINNSGLPCGVRLLPSGMYQSRISFKGRLISLGVYDTPKDAELRYKKERDLLFKQYSRK